MGDKIKISLDHEQLKWFIQCLLSDSKEYTRLTMTYDITIDMSSIDKKVIRGEIFNWLNRRI